MTTLICDCNQTMPLNAQALGDAALFARHVDAERALSEGFDQHLAKPAAPATLVEVVAHLAGRG